VVDTALVRGERGAEEGRLALFCGGPADVIDALRPVVAPFAADVVRVGEVGAGQVAKTANNILLWACIRADVEALRLGRALGVEQPRSHCSRGLVHESYFHHHVFGHAPELVIAAFFRQCPVISLLQIFGTELGRHLKHLLSGSAWQRAAVGNASVFPRFIRKPQSPHILYTVVRDANRDIVATAVYLDGGYVRLLDLGAR